MGRRGSESEQYALATLSLSAGSVGKSGETVHTNQIHVFPLFKFQNNMVSPSTKRRTLPWIYIDSYRLKLYIFL